MATRRQILAALGGTLIAGPGLTDEPPSAPPADCVFCQIIAGAREASVVYRDERCLAFADRYPLAPGHTLLMPLAHLQNIYSLDAGLAGHLFAVAARIAGQMKQVWRPDGLTLVQNNEPAGDQTIFHFHIHLVPRTRGQPLFVPVHRRGEPAREERERHFAPLRAALS